MKTLRRHYFRFDPQGKGQMLLTLHQLQMGEKELLARHDGIAVSERQFCRTPSRLGCFFVYSIDAEK
jgi:hypothetical protein